MQDNRLTSKVVLVTGAAKRIGANISRTLHDAGMNIVLHYHTQAEEAKQLSEELNQKRPDSAAILAMDLQETAQLPKFIHDAAAVWGRLDALVNNASRFYKTHIGQVTEAAWDDLLNVNLKAPFFLAQAAAPFLSKTEGVMVNITDIHAERPLRDYPVYCVSKSGLLMLTKALARELGPKVRVNAVAPGAIAWPEGENEMTSDIKNKIIDSTCLKRSGSAADIAEAVLFFIRDAGYITGQVISVDGGRYV